MIYAKKIAELQSKLGKTRSAAAVAHLDKNKDGYLHKAIEALQAELEKPAVAATPAPTPAAVAPAPKPAATAPAPQPVKQPALAETKPPAAAGKYDPTKPRTRLLQDSRLPQNHPWNDPQ